MSQAYIVDAVRTPVGKKERRAEPRSRADLGAHALTALMERTGIDPRAVDDVVFGCVDAIGPMAGDIARTCWLSAGLPEEVPGVTIDRQLRLVAAGGPFAAQAVMSGTSEMVVRRRRADHERDSHRLVHAGRPAARLRAIRWRVRAAGPSVTATSRCRSFARPT